MKKIVISFFVVGVIISLGIVSRKYFNNDENLISDKTLISYYVETGVATGEYKKVNSDKWPEGYLFNSVKSTCSNGGTVSWDNNNNSVVEIFNSEDKCKIYFDNVNYNIDISLSLKSVFYDSVSINVEIDGNTNYIASVVGSLVEISSDPADADGDEIDIPYPYNGESFFDFSVNDLKKANKYKLIIRLYDKNKRSIVSDNIFFSTLYYDSCIEGTFACNLVKSFIKNGVNGFYYHDNNLENSAQDRSYRYSGKNPNNYVCFGSDIAPCPEDNVYRIIGVFGDRAKLVKNVDIGSYYYDERDIGGSWSTNPLNVNILNDEYLISLGSYANMIDDSEWYTDVVYPNEHINVFPSEGIFRAEISRGMNANNATNGKIGMLYLSEFGFAAEPQYWNKLLTEYDVNSNNWLAYSKIEWTLTPYERYDAPYYSYYLCDNAVMGCDAYYSRMSVRPTFYLKSSIKLSDGNGTKENPYRVSY